MTWKLVGQVIALSFGIPLGLGIGFTIAEKISQKLHRY